MPCMATLTRRSLLTTAAASLTGSPAILRGQRRPPNFVFIMADDLGYGHLGCYGQKKIRTPVLDRMAAEGVRFTQAYAGNTVCAPSRCTLMTGMHAGHCSIRGNDGGIPLQPTDVTLAETLKAAGYVNGCFGKWGLGEAGTGHTPNERGFDEFFGYLHQLHAHFYYTHFLWKNGRKQWLANRHDWRRDYTHDVIAAEALAFIRKNRGNPFFLYLPFTIPHAELLVPEDSLAEYEGAFPETPFTSKPRMHYAPHPTPKAALAGMITRMDRSIGQVLSTLAALGLEDNTLVLFTSDNGPDRDNGNDPDFFQAAGPFRGYKRDLYEGGIRVPMIARWPGRTPAGAVNHVQWGFQDVLPTFAELAGTPAPREIDGRSVVRPLLDPQSPAGQRAVHDHLYWETWSDGLDGQAVRAGDWKALRPKRHAPLELYDLVKDPGERNNVAATQAETVARLEGLLQTAHVPPPAQIEPEKPDGKRYF